MRIWRSDWAQLAALADADMAQRLGAEVDGPADLDPLRIDVETLEIAAGQPGVVVVALVLHPRRQRDHRQVVGVGDAIDVAGQANRDGRQGDALGQSAAGGRALDVERGPAAGLADRPAHALAELSQALDQAERRGGLALAQRGRGDGRDVDVLSGGGILQPSQDLLVVHLGQPVSVGDELVVSQTQLAGELLNRLHVSLGRLGDLPVLHATRIQLHHTDINLTILQIRARQPTTTIIVENRQNR